MITANSAGSAGVSSEVVLFAFDDHSIPLRDNLTLSLNQVRKHPLNPVLTHGKPGAPDDRGCLFYGTIIPVEGKLCMWYMALHHDATGQRPLGSMAYAESHNGVDWFKPKLGLVEWNGNRDNNLCLLEPDPDRAFLGVLDYIGVLHDPTEPDPQRRYKVCFQRPVPAAELRRVGADVRAPIYAMTTAVSADGLRWRVLDSDRPPIDQAFQVCGLYRFGGIYYAAGQQLPPWVWLPHGDRCGRVMTVVRSSDFDSWDSASSLAFVRPGYRPMPSGEGEEVTSAAGIWNRGNVLVGLYGMWHGVPGSWPDPWASNHVDLGLIVSNDGLHFREPVPDFAMIPRGGTDEWDCKALLPAYAFANMGNHTYVWYGTWDSHKDGHQEAIGLGILRRDGFGYLSPKHAGVEAHFITCGLRMSGPARLYLNVGEVTPETPLRVELRDERGQPVPGYAQEECVPITSPGLRQHVGWKNRDRIDVPPSVEFNVCVSYGSGFDAMQRVYALYVSDDDLD